MKQTIEIEVPNDKKAVWKDGKVVLEDINPQLPKTWEEFCKQNEIKRGECLVDDWCCVKDIVVGTRHEIVDRNVLPNKRVAEQYIALMQLHQLRDCYRQGWKPNWNNSEPKYCITHYGNGYIVECSTIITYFLAFQSEERAEKFLDNFGYLIEQAGDLI